MSLTIDVRQVAGVLLADGWHNIEVGTFAAAPGVVADAKSSMGIGDTFGFREMDEERGLVSVFVGPWSSVLAVRMAR